jgi:hypothetical protein
MEGFDNATWQALGLVLTVLGLVVSALVWSRRGPASGLRAVAWSLIPLAAGLTGVLRLGWEITDSVLDWAVRLVFSPMVWIGIVVAVVSLLLFVVSGWMRRRSPRTRTSRRAAGSSKAPEALPREQSAPSTAAQTAGSGGDDMADIEEILRKHGIT